jgi:hypothetical protein
MYALRKIVLALLTLGLLLLSLSPVVPVRAQGGHKALILSSLQKLVPIRDDDLTGITRPLVAAGYIITYLVDDQITVKLFTTRLNSFDVIIWRTNVYENGHTTYWYLGEVANEATLQQYTSDFESKWLDSSHGVIGVNADFFQNHFRPGSLRNVKLAILVSSISSSIAGFFLNGGVRSVVEFSGSISLQFGTVDNVIGRVMHYLSEGYDVADAVANTLTPYFTMEPKDPLDSVSIPPIAYSGDSTLTIA